MKKLYSLYKTLPHLFLLLAFGKGWGQTEIFNQSGGGTVSGWTFTNNVTTNVIDQTSYWLVDAGNPSDIITTSSYDLSAYTSATFSLQVASYGSGTHRAARVEVSYNGGTTYTDIFTSSTTTGSSYNTADIFNLLN